MKLSVRWLKRHLPDLALSPEALAPHLVRMGIEVAAIEPFGEEWGRIRLGLMVDRRPHPNADQLSLATVDLGDGNRVEIVTGAPNGQPGDRVWLAPPGARLADGRVIEPVEFRGVVSPGMLCSGAELGFDAGGDGLWIWNGEEPPGSTLLDALGGPDTVLELELTPNLAMFDQSVLGIARELAAALDLALPPVPERFGFGRAAIARVADARACPLYTLAAGELSPGVHAPLWMQRLLRAVGQRPIAGAVDVTNFILWDLGQPVHVFDADRVRLPLTVRYARDGEVIRLLDGSERTLTPADLVIADAVGPQALAGVMGGADSAVDLSTTRILLESAHFEPAGVFQTMKRLDLHSESALRFGKGTDPTMAARAAARFWELMGTTARPNSEQSVAVGEIPPARVIPWDPERVRRLLGVGWNDAKLSHALERLGFVFEGDGVRVPHHRPDVEGIWDLAEEVARLVGLDAIETRLPHSVMTVGKRVAADAWRDQWRTLFTAAGFTEAVTRAFSSPEREAWLDLATPPIVIQNPLREEERQMRRSLLPGLLEAVAYNRARGDWPVALFEIGPVFVRGAGRSQEPFTLAAVQTLDTPAQWPHTEAPAIADLKGAFSWVADRLGVAWEPLSGNTPPPFLHPGRALVLGDGAGQAIGFLGELLPALAERYQCRRVGVLSIELPAAPATPDLSVTRPSRFPEVERDVSLVLPENIAYRDIARAIESAACPILRAFGPVDRFVGDFGVSLTVRLHFQSMEATLTDDVVQAAVDDLLHRLHSLGIRLRG